MKKNVLTTAKSIIIAAAVCAGIALGVVSTISTPETQEQTIVATHPNFVEGIW